MSSEKHSWIDFGFDFVKLVAGGLSPSEPVKNKCNKCPDTREHKTRNKGKHLKIRRKRWLTTP